MKEINFLILKSINKASDEIYSEYNLLHPDNWELIDRVGAIYKRLVVWDGKLIHSASSYSDFIINEDDKEAEKSRLV